MDYIDILINAVENVLFAFLTSAYIEIKGRKRIIYILDYSGLTVPLNPAIGTNPIPVADTTYSGNGYHWHSQI